VDDDGVEVGKREESERTSGRRRYKVSWVERTNMTEPDRSLDGAINATTDLRATVLAGAGTEQVTLDGLARRVLAADIVAEGDVPAHSKATMDGVALDTGDDPPLSLSDDRVVPGDDPPDHDPGTARRVATGAPIPAGADAVLPREDTTVEDGRLTAAPAASGDHVVHRGSVVAAGETVLSAGRLLAPRDAALLADLGRETVAVRERLSTAILATGTEIHEGREPDRDSAFLANLVGAWGGDPVLAGSVPDDPVRVGERVRALAANHDVVVTTGGTGVSETDETRETLGTRTEVRVSDVPVRPGSNSTVTWLADAGAVAVSLPGPPGAAFVSATLLARPLFVGRSRPATLAGTMTCDLPVPDRDLTFAVPVEVRDDVRIVPFGHPTSTVELYDGRFRPHRVATCTRLSAADGFVLTGGDLRSGERVAVHPYTRLES
jgi:molybdopterin molybdotransferase